MIQLIQFLNQKREKIILAIFSFVGLYLISYTINPYAASKTYFQLSYYVQLLDIISSLLLSILIVELCFYIDNKLNTFLPWSNNTSKRLILQTLLHVVLHFLLLISYAALTFFIMQVFNIDYNEVVSNELTIRETDLYNYILNFTFLTMLVSMIHTVYFLATSWKREIMTIASYRVREAENRQNLAQSELEALRLQLDPHFVFNNLSVLSELILKDQHLGFEYTENFSIVYRYLLINAKKQLISLHEEIKFLKCYLFLLEKRMGSGIVFEVSIDKEKLNLKLPPITLQLLVENAIKHNRIDKDNPLKIKIYTNDSNELVVENAILPLFKNPISAGVGLENIISRYSIISELTPKIIDTKTKFIVKIPLLK